MRKVGSTVPKRLRNAGFSFGLRFKYIYGRVAGQALVWNRHTGKVVYVAPRYPDNLWQGFALQDAQKRCEWLCATQIGRKDGRLPIDHAAIDSTP